MPRFLITVLGVVVGILVVVISAFFIGNLSFNRMVDAEIDGFLANRVAGSKETRRVMKEDLDGLPQNVRRWLESSGVIGKEYIQTVRLEQQSSLRLNEEQAWMGAQAEQYFRTVEPGFIWKVDIKMNPLMPIVGRDKYDQGHGHMLIKVLSLIPVADARGAEIDQGTMLRYLGEMVWFPTAALSDYLQWEELSDDQAQVTMNYGGITASGVFTFDKDGFVESFSAKRYMENQGKYSLEDWIVETKENKEFNGIVIPYKGDVTWQLESGDFRWFSYEIIDIEYN